MEQYVTLRTLAEEFGIDRSNLRKYVLAHGFQPLKVRTPESRNQATLALSSMDADELRGIRSRKGFLTPGTPVH